MKIEGDYSTSFGYSLHYRLDGSGSEKILLVIGFCSSAAYWGPLVDAIHSKYPGRYTTCIYDQRGTGLSSTSVAEKFSSVTIARDAIGLLLHLNWVEKNTPLHLIAWSMGGFGSIELINSLLREVGATLNLCSLTLCNTGHKFSFLPARAWLPVLRSIGKGFLSFFFGVPTKWMIPDILKLHYSRSFLKDVYNSQMLAKEYESRSPFNAPLSKSLVTIIQHFYAVLTHYVSRDRMKAIRDSGISLHSVVSSEDILIHPTASMTLARILNCDFSYLAGGHMSHVENTDVIVERLVAIWDIGLDKKYPQYKKYQPLNGTISRAMSVGTPTAMSHVSSISGGSRSNDWPLTEAATIALLNKLVLSGMDKWSLISIIKRMRQPGRLFIAPALIFPIVIIQLRKIILGNLSKTERYIELSLLMYVLFLVFVVHEVTREEG